MSTGSAKTEVFEYAGDPVAIYEQAGPAWRGGRNVVVKIGETLIPYFDFVIMSRRSDHEPIAEIARFIITRRAMRKAYESHSHRMATKYSKVLGWRTKKMGFELWRAIKALEDNDALR